MTARRAKSYWIALTAARAPMKKSGKGLVCAPPWCRKSPYAAAAKNATPKAGGERNVFYTLHRPSRAAPLGLGIRGRHWCTMIFLKIECHQSAMQFVYIIYFYFFNIPKGDVDSAA